MSYIEIIEDIETLPRYREYTCGQCGHKQMVHSLVIQAHCKKCGVRSKLRRYAYIGSEIEDVVDTVLAWLGEGEDLKLAMERKQTIDSCEDEDWPWDKLERSQGREE